MTTRNQTLDAMAVTRRRSRSISPEDALDTLDCGRRLVIQNTFFQLVGREEPRSTTPPARRRTRSAPPMEIPCLEAPDGQGAPQAAGARSAAPVAPPGPRSGPPAEAGLPAGAGAPACAKACEGQLTTVVIRNMPQAFTRNVFLQLLNDNGFERNYDFVYLPIDFGRRCSFGYAFVNLVSPQVAQRFHEVFDGFCDWNEPWDSPAEVGWATLQGLGEHVEKYRNSPVMHESVDSECKPILLKDGKPAEFPPPTKKIGLVKRLRTRRKSRTASSRGGLQEQSPGQCPTGESTSTETVTNWDYQDTDEELQPTKQYYHRTPTVGGLASSLAESPLLAGLYTLESEQSSAISSPRRPRRMPPGCFSPTKRPGLDSDQSDSSTRPPTSGSLASVSGSSARSGRSGHGGRVHHVPRQHLAASFSVLAHGLMPAPDNTQWLPTACPR